jgi:hypothetical protein
LLSGCFEQQQVKQRLLFVDVCSFSAAAVAYRGTFTSLVHCACPHWHFLVLPLFFLSMLENSVDRIGFAKSYTFFYIHTLL